MSGFHKAVCLAAMVALALPTLHLRAADPVFIANDAVDIQAQIVIPGEIRIVGGILLPGPAINRAPRDLSDEVAAELFPIVGQGFASDRPVTGAIAPLIKALHADSYAQRQKASEDLMCLPPDRLTDVIAALAKETDAEAISRLKTVAGHLYLKPRTNVKAAAGFLGIGGMGAYVSMLGMKFDNPERMRLPGQEQDAVVVRVSELQPGFPSAQELRSGDCIVAIEGKRFPEEMVPIELVGDGGGEDTFIVSNMNRQRQEEAKKMFQTRIRGLWPGGVAKFTVVRDNKVIEIPVQLAAMPANNKDSLSSLVEIRNQLMATFVESLPTGEDSHVRTEAMSSRSLASGTYDWGTIVVGPGLGAPGMWEGGVLIPIRDWGSGYERE